MDCDRAREAVSLALDGALAPGEQDDLGRHLERCGGCAGHRRSLERLRRAVRYEAVGHVPDVARVVVPQAAAWQRRRRRREGLTVAALFLVAAVAGASFVGFDTTEPAQVRAAMSERVLTAQAGVTALEARLEVVERGWHPLVPERRYAGRLAYRAPESLALVLTDRTAYRDERFVPNDIEAVTDGATWWARGSVPCPADALPDCLGAEMPVRALTGREPFPATTPAPLDLVVPVQSFALAAEPSPLGRREVSGRTAFGIATTAGQVAPLVEGLRQAGTMREVHPADPVHLWLDEDSLVPLAWSVRAAEGSQRAQWASRHGYTGDRAGGLLLSVRLEGVSLDGDVGAGAFPPAPAGTAPRDGGFVDRPPDRVDVPQPRWLPDGMAPHRTGVMEGSGGAPPVAVASWSDGRAWVKVRATRDWEGGRLFGRPGDVVREVRLGSGVAYLGEGGRTVALHGAGIDLVVTGSLPESHLLLVAAGLGVEGLHVPPGWSENGTVGVDRLGEHLPGALVPPRLAGFAPAAARVLGDTAVVAVAGGGARGFVLTQQPGSALVPPLDPDVLGVEVRGVAGRYTPRTGELEWVEGGRVVSLRSATLPLEELLWVAGALEPAR